MKKIFILLGCIALGGCEPTLIAEFEDLPVVTCYLDAGSSPVLTVSKLIAFRDDVTYSGEDVSALSITITDQTVGTPYPMQPTGGGGYACPQLTVQAGRAYRLDFAYNGKPVSAATTVPEAPQDVVFSDTAIGVMSFTMPSRADVAGGIEITWSNDERNYYIVEGFTESSNAVRESDDEPAKSFKLDYTQGGSATLTQQQFNYFGNYEVSLIRIRSEYVVMSQGSSDASTTLVDVRGNIEGGYGIFTGINRVTRTIEVYERSNPMP